MSYPLGLVDCVQLTFTLFPTWYVVSVGLNTSGVLGGIPPKSNISHRSVLFRLPLLSVASR